MSNGKRGRPCLISAELKKQVQKIVTNNKPIPLRLGYAFWTAGALQEYLDREYNKSISPRTASKFLAEWGLTTHRRQRAFEFDECITADWYKKNVSEIPEANGLDPVALEKFITEKARQEVATLRYNISAEEKQAAKTKNSFKKRCRTRQPKVIEEPDDFIPLLKTKHKRNVGTTAFEMEFLTGRFQLSERVLKYLAFKLGYILKPKSAVEHEENMEPECTDNIFRNNHNNGTLFPNRPFSKGVRRS